MLKKPVILLMLALALVLAIVPKGLADGPAPSDPTTAPAGTTDPTEAELLLWEMYMAWLLSGGEPLSDPPTDPYAPG